jgi:hypothetical protein
VKRGMAAAASAVLAFTLTVGGCGPGYGERFSHQVCHGHGGLAYWHDIKGLAVAYCNDGTKHVRGVFG